VSVREVTIKGSLTIIYAVDGDEEWKNGIKEDQKPEMMNEVTFVVPSVSVILSTTN
jgi:hypothetical protein